MAEHRRLLQQLLHQGDRAVQRNDAGCRGAAAEFQRRALPAGQLHRIAQERRQRDNHDRRPRRQQVVGGQRQVPGFLPPDRDPLRVSGRVADRRGRQCGLQRLQGCRSRHQHRDRSLLGIQTPDGFRQGDGVERGRLRGFHRLRVLPAGREHPDRVDGGPAAAGRPTGRCSGAAVPDHQDQPVDDLRQAVEGGRPRGDRRDHPGRPG